jgi:hypothetical protein
VVQAHPELAEPLIRGRPFVLMDAEHCAALEHPQQMPEAGIGVLVEDRVGVRRTSSICSDCSCAALAV